MDSFCNPPQQTQFVSEYSAQQVIGRRWNCCRFRCQDCPQVPRSWKWTKAVDKARSSSSGFNRGRKCLDTLFCETRKADVNPTSCPKTLRSDPSRRLTGHYYKNKTRTISTLYQKTMNFNK